MGLLAASSYRNFSHICETGIRTRGSDTTGNFCAGRETFLIFDARTNTPPTRLLARAQLLLLLKQANRKTGGHACRTFHEEPADISKKKKTSVCCCA